MSTISVQIDATQVPAQQREAQRIRVAARSGERTSSTVVSVASGKATAKLNSEGSGPITIAVGPESSTADELFNRNTPTLSVRPTLVDGKSQYTIRPIVITEPIWAEWLIWCRTFTITGYLMGLDGNPVPGAQLSAFNVDRFWWWSSTQQVGPTVITDPNGYFSITFEWCCGWLPWYWWALRQWRLDPVLVDKIESVLQLNPELRVNPPSPILSLGVSELNPQPLPPSPAKQRALTTRTGVSATEIGPTNLAALRDQMLNLLPAVPEFERICLWPWCPWWPWLDCDPNIIFQATQSCGGLSQVILSETVWQAQMDIPTNLNVTLTANANACTIPSQQTGPEGACFLFTGCCSEQASSIGLTGSGVLAGFADPGSEDRPFTGGINITGQFGFSASDLDYADYYGIQYRSEGTTAWIPVPQAALQGFQRTYFDATQPWPNQWFFPGFAPSNMPLAGPPGNLVTVYEGLQFYEMNNPPNNWGDVLNGRSWTANQDMVAVIDTAGYFTDGAYEFQIVGYTYESNGTLSPNGALPGCGQPNSMGVNDNNDFSLFFANPGSSEQNPDALISSVLINGANLPPCGILTLPTGAPISLEVLFTASDTEGYLDSYGLQLQWGTNGPSSLFSCGCANPPTPSCGLSAGAGVEVLVYACDVRLEGVTISHPLPWRR